MKEIIIISSKMRDDGPIGYYKVRRFVFNKSRGVITTEVTMGLETNTVSYRSGYAVWGDSGIVDYSTFYKNDDKLYNYSEFIKAFKKKFDVDIPLI